MDSSQQATDKTTSGSSYGTIVKSSSIIGGSQVITYAIGLVSTKAKALLIGPTGVGLFGIYGSVVSICQTIAGMGLASSGVREIASQQDASHREQRAQLQLALRRLGLIFGLLVAGLLAVLSPWVSQALFQTKEQWLNISLLGLLFVFSGLALRNQATLQGLRQIFKIGKASVSTGVLGAAVTITLIYFWGIHGILPSMLMGGLLTLTVSYYFAYPHLVRPSDPSWRTTFIHAQRLIPLGAAVAWGALLAEIPPLLARSYVVRDYGLQYNGYYVAAWALSGLFINILINALSVDFYPRLSAVANDKPKANRIISEQTEIGIIAALPGVMGLILFAPLIIQLLYSSAFLPAAALMPWFVLGLFGRIVSWPMAMILLAKGDAKFFGFAQTVSVSVSIVLQLICFHQFGMEGLAMAFALQYVWYYAAVRIVGKLRYDLDGDSTCDRLLLTTLLAMLAAVIIQQQTFGWLNHALSALMILLVATFSAWQMATRLHDHPKVKPLLSKIGHHLPFNFPR